MISTSHSDRQPSSYTCSTNHLHHATEPILSSSLCYNHPTDTLGYPHRFSSSISSFETSSSLRNLQSADEKASSSSTNSSPPEKNTPESTLSVEKRRSSEMKEVEENRREEAYAGDKDGGILSLSLNLSLSLSSQKGRRVGKR